MPWQVVIASHNSFYEKFTVWINIHSIWWKILMYMVYDIFTYFFVFTADEAFFDCTMKQGMQISLFCEY